MTMNDVAGFTPVLPSSISKPPSRTLANGELHGPLFMLRNNFYISTWILIGAFLQIIIILTLPLSIAIALTAVPLLFRFGQTALSILGLVRNRRMDDAVIGKVSAQIPSRDGIFHSSPSAEKVVVMMLGAKSNHPMGYLSGEFKKMGDFNQAMSLELDKNAPNNGFLGQTTWINAADSDTASELMYLSYWRSIEDIHTFAHGPTHREAWEWWNKSLKEHDYLGIHHEIFSVDRHQWECIYINFQPTGLGATTYLKKGDKMEGGQVQSEWIRPLVQAAKGGLRSSSGRLGWSSGDEHDVYGANPYVR